MFCSRCGTLNPDNAVHCTHCGQPLSAGGQPVKPFYGQTPPAIPTRLPQAILVTMFCCQPFGIVAIVYAALCSSKLSAGDYVGAMDCSQKATTWCWLAFWLGLIPTLLWLGFIVIAAVAGEL